MIVWVLVPTACVVTLFAVVGAGQGGRALGRSLALLACSAVIACAVGWAAWRAQLFQPFGLLTPLVGALVALVVCRVVLVRVWSAPAVDASMTNRVAGGLLGGALGLYVAAWGWTLVDVAVGACAQAVAPVAAKARDQARTPEGAAAARMVGSGGAKSEKPAAKSAVGLQDLLRIAQRGFVRHLPIVGSVSEECQATIDLLNTPPELCQQLVAKQAWLEWSRLPGYQELCCDPGFRCDLRALRNGDVTALYRLQRNRLLVSLVARGEARGLLAGWRPTALAAQLRACVDEMSAANMLDRDR
ncbi:MAG: hypothetical protein AB8H80_09840 [Planctomycetota bacterium]